MNEAVEAHIITEEILPKLANYQVVVIQPLLPLQKQGTQCLQDSQLILLASISSQRSV